MLDFVKKVVFGHHPIPERFRHSCYRELPFLAIDLELTGLDAEHNKVTSIGWVAGRGECIQLQDAHYSVVRAKGELNQSPVIHGLTPKVLQSGEHIRDQLIELSKLAEEHIWVFHNAALDMKVLSRLWSLLELPEVTVTTADTMLMQVYYLEKTQGFVPKGGVTLASSRRYFELPPSPEHNALDDALSTLTLLFAQLYNLNKQGHMNLLELSHTRAIKTFTLGQ